MEIIWIHEGLAAHGRYFVANHSNNLNRSHTPQCQPDFNYIPDLLLGYDSTPVKWLLGTKELKSRSSKGRVAHNSVLTIPAVSQSQSRTQYTCRGELRKQERNITLLVKGKNYVNYDIFQDKKKYRL